MSEAVSSVEPIEKEAVKEPTTEEVKTGDEAVPPAEKALPKEGESEVPPTEKPADTPAAEAIALPPAGDAAAVPANDAPTEEAKVTETPKEGEAVPPPTEDTKPADIEVA